MKKIFELKAEWKNLPEGCNSIWWSGSPAYARGYKLKNRSARTVAFIFGEVCFETAGTKGTRKVRGWMAWVREHSRFSMELIHQINQISTCTTYRKTADLIEFMTGINLTKDTVLKAVKLCCSAQEGAGRIWPLVSSGSHRGKQKSPERLLHWGWWSLGQNDLNKERKPNIAISLITSSIQEASRLASPNAGVKK